MEHSPSSSTAAKIRKLSVILALVLTISMVMLLCACSHRGNESDAIAREREKQKIEHCFSYDPVPVMNVIGDTADLTADRSLTITTPDINNSPYDRHITFADQWVVNNKSDRDIELTVMYPLYQSECPEGFMKVNGEAVTPKSNFASDALNIRADRQDGSFPSKLTDKTYLNEILSDREILDKEAVLYTAEYTYTDDFMHKFINGEVPDFQIKRHAVMNVKYDPDKTQVFLPRNDVIAYSLTDTDDGFTAEYDFKAYPYDTPRAETEPRYEFLAGICVALGDDDHSVEVTCDYAEDDVASISIQRERMSLRQVFEKLVSADYFSNGGVPREGFYEEVSRTISAWLEGEYPIFDEENNFVERVKLNGKDVSCLFNVELTYFSYDLTVPANGQTVIDFSYDAELKVGLDFVPGTSSEVEIKNYTLTLTGENIVECTQNLGLDMSSGQDTVNLKPDRTDYYLDFIDYSNLS